jgi:hypothetical protein
MTFKDFKDMFYELRDHKAIRRSLIRSLEELERNGLSSISSGAVDYSADHVQKTPDTDARLINAIAKVDQERQKILDKLGKLQADDEKLERLIYGEPGIEGEILRLFFIEGKPMEPISSTAGYSSRHCWRLAKNTLYKIYIREGYENEMEVS